MYDVGRRQEKLWGEKLSKEEKERERESWEGRQIKLDTVGSVVLSIEALRRT